MNWYDFCMDLGRNYIRLFLVDNGGFMRNEKEATKMKIEKGIMRVSLVASILVAVAEGIMAYYLHSKTILMDCVFACFDLLMMCPLLALIPYLYKPVSEERPYGFAQVESLFVCIKYGVLFAVIINLIWENVKVIIAGGHIINAGVVVVFEFVLSVFSVFIFLLLRHFSEKYSSMIIKSELYMWKVDIISTCSILCAFAAQLVLVNTQAGFIIPYIDSGVAITIAVFMLKEPLVEIKRNLKELILFAPKEEVMEEIRMAVEKAMADFSYQLAFLDVIQTGRKTWVEIYVKGKDDIICVHDFKMIRKKVLESLNKKFDQIYVEVIPELEKSEQTV